MKRIGVITNFKEGIFQSQIIDGIEEIASHKNYEVEVNCLNERHAITLDLAQLEGVAVIANAAPDDYLRDAHARSIPITLISHYDPELPVPVIISNHYQGIAALVKHLIEDCQRQQIVFVGGVPGQYDAIEREQAFRRELMRYTLSLPEDNYLIGEFDPDIARQAIRTFLATGQPFNAVLATDYVMAIAIVEELQSAGIRVPEDVSVVGFGDAPQAEEAGLTTVAADIREHGRRAAYQLFSQIEGLQIYGVTILGIDLYIRETSCKPTR